jgi:recombination protein RecA
MGAWIGDARISFYPPDLAACGVDLAALTVLRLESAKLWHGCDTLLRCGGFALILVDVCGALTLPFPMQTRLAGLAQHHNTALIALARSSRRDQPRSSLASLRAETALRRAGRDCFACEARIVKDKRRVPGWAHEEFRRGTNSLC